MATKASKSGSSQAQKRGLSILRKRGLYRPKNPKAPITDYGKKQLRKYADVISGNATVLTVPKTKKSKGYATARKNADPSLGVYAVRNKIVVPKREGEKVSFSKKDKAYRVTRTVNGVKYIREPVNRKITRPDQIKLKKGERIAIPFNRGRKGIEWAYVSEDEFNDFWLRYRENGTYDTLGDNLFFLKVA